jgi:ABC-2 type transport system ATP-binding protein
MEDSILSVKNVSKYYSGHQALNDVSFEVQKGCIFGLLGPNGAGKTSLIRIITNITQADQGSVLFEGKNTTNIDRGLIAYMPEERGLYKKNESRRTIGISRCSKAYTRTGSSQ